MALIKDMQETRIIYVGQYKGFVQMGPSIPSINSPYMSSAFAVSRLFTTFLMDDSVEVIIEEEDPGSELSGVHRTMYSHGAPMDSTYDIRFLINRCFND